MGPSKREKDMYSLNVQRLFSGLEIGLILNTYKQLINTNSRYI